MSIAEIELVADNFFPNKKNTMYLVAVLAIVDQLMNSEQTAAVTIEKEVSRYRVFCNMLSMY